MPNKNKKKLYLPVREDAVQNKKKNCFAGAGGRLPKEEIVLAGARGHRAEKKEIVSQVREDT